MQVRPKPPTVSQSITHETMQTFVPIFCVIALLYCLPFTGAAEAKDISPRPSHSVVANPSNSAPVEPSTKFIGSAKVGSTVTGESTPLHKGRTTMVWQTHIRNDTGKLCAVVTQTQLVLG